MDRGLLLWQNVFAMHKPHPKMDREGRTIAVMIGIYCHAQHGNGGLCAECSELLAYADERLRLCPFQEGKTTCAKCHVHCFQPDMREKTRVVMRYSGPRMLRRHPILAMRHFLDRTRKEPVRCKKVAGSSPE